ncbi:MAG TPA: hypothetical protein VFG20_08805 [Planctomycetaceae bacterium]|nr:hypothetical protein [Planctomycetaceae bacterium]
MSWLWITLADALLLLLIAVGLLRLRPLIRHTTLTTVWPWTWLAWTAAVIAWALRFNESALNSYADYFTAVAALSPPMATLGARQPTCRSWPFFVMLPMFAVLLWPAVSVGLATRFARPLVLETPAVVMYLLVLVMAWGNYVFSRTGVLVVLFAGLLAGAVSQSARLPNFSPNTQRTLLLAVSAVMISRFRLTSYPALAPLHDESLILKWKLDQFDQILTEFSDLYGLVWSLRLQDRLNVFAQQKGWPAQFVGQRGGWKEPLTETQVAEVEQAFRWLFRRFVHPEWLNARLQSPGTAVASEKFASPIDS